MWKNNKKNSMVNVVDVDLGHLKMGGAPLRSVVKILSEEKSIKLKLNFVLLLIYY